MNREPPSLTADLPPTIAIRIDDTCDRFEQAWKGLTPSEPPPAIEDFLPGVPEADVPFLLQELVLIDVHYRRTAGQALDPRLYATRFPSLDDAWLVEVLADPNATSTDGPSDPSPTVSSVRVRCPFCHNPISLSDGRSEEVVCPACGSPFHLQDTRATSTHSEMRQVGKFQLLERVGLGAFGAVWRARDVELDRLVALKIPHASLLGSATDRERFAREARAAAQLRHPGIVTVHEVALLGGLPVIVADFIHGVTLRDLLQVRRLTHRESAEVVIQVSEALAYAHALGLVHRDVKPANIMFQEHDAGPVDDEWRQPPSAHSPLRTYLMDFGLALRDEAEATLTQDGQIIGTPAYMSPEQAAGQGHEVDGRCDIYSLGVILYELLCGELPFRGSRMMIVHQVVHDEPPPPRRLDARIPQDLQTICLKCLAKAPANRYGSAQALIDDLRRFLADEPIRARPIGVGERSLRWARRRPLTAGLLVISAFLLVAGTVASTYFAIRANAKAADAEAEARKAREAQGRAEKAEGEARRLIYASRLNQMQRDFDQGRLPRFHDPQGATGDSEPPYFEWHYFRRLGSSGRLVFTGAEDQVRSVAWSADGEKLAMACANGTVHVWHAGSEKHLFDLKGHAEAKEAQRRVNAVVFSPDGKRLATVGNDATVRLWDATTGQNLQIIREHTDAVQAAAFSPDGKWLATGSADRTVRIWMVDTGKLLVTYRGHAGEVTSVAFSPDGKRIASAGNELAIHLWDAEIGEAATKLEGHDDPILSVVFSPDGARLASGSADRSAIVWNLASGLPMHRLRGRSDNQPGPGHQSAVLAVAFSPDGKRLATGSADQSVRLWDYAAEQETAVLLGHTGWVRSVAFRPDGQRLATGSEDRTARVWLTPGVAEYLALRGHEGAVQALAFGGPNRRLASAGADGTIKVWDPTDGWLEYSLSGHSRIIHSVVFSPDGSRLASASRDKSVRLWDRAERKELAVLLGHDDEVTSAAFSPDGLLMASSSSDRSIKLWDLKRNEELASLRGHIAGVDQVVFAGDQIVLSAGLDGAVKVWDVAKRQEVRTLVGHSGKVHAVAYSASAGLMASAGADQQILLWDATTGTRLLTLKGHAGAVRCVAFSPDGQRLASGGADGEVKLWDVASGQELLSMRGHKHVVTAVCFRDNLCLASAGQDGLVLVWNAAPPTLREIR